MSDSEIFRYWLAMSAVSFTGTCTTTTPVNGGRPTTKYQSTTSLITRADIQQGPVRLAVKDGHTDNKLALGLTEDGRLTSSDLDSTGEGTALLGSVVSIITDLATVAGAVIKPAVRAADTDEPSEHDPKKDFPGKEQLDQLTASEGHLTDYLITLSAHIAGAPDGALPPTRPRPDDLSVVQTALHLVSQQRDRLTKEQVAWESATHTTSSMSGSYTVDVRDLPTSVSFDPTKEMSQAAKAVWDELGIMMCIVDDGEPRVAVPSSSSDQTTPFQDDAGPIQDGAETSIWYRLPRRVRLDLWKRKNGQQGDEELAELVQSTQAEIVDKHCPHVAIPLIEGKLFGHNTISVKMGALGTPISISDEQVPSLVNAATALSKVPSAISSGITDTSGVIAAWQSAVPSAAAQQTATLEAQKDRLQLLADIKKLGGVPVD